MKYCFKDGVINNFEKLKNVKVVNINDKTHLIADESFFDNYHLIKKDGSNDSNVIVPKVDIHSMPYYFYNLDKYLFNLCLPEKLLELMQFDFSQFKKISFENNDYFIIKDVLLIDVDFNQYGTAFDERIFKSKFSLCYNIISKKDITEEFFKETFRTPEELIKKYFNYGKFELIELIKERNKAKKYLKSKFNSSESNCLYINN